MTPEEKIAKWLESLKNPPKNMFCVPGKDCNECPLLENTPHNRYLYAILSTARDKFGDEFYLHVENICPNLTCCPVCRVDDFTHIEGCYLDREIATKEVSTK